jgi:arylsulfatase A-like enzyme
MSDVRHVVVISVDDLRADCIGCEPDRPDLADHALRSPPATPTIDAAATEGVRFRQCISVSSYTPPSHASMLTGLYPWRHGVSTFYERLREDAPTLAERLAGMGYRTIASTEHVALRDLEITRGFERVHDHTEPTAERFYDELRGLARAGRPVFAFLHLFDAHAPYFFLKGRPWWRRNEEYEPRLAGLFESHGLAMGAVMDEARREARRVVADFDRLDEYMQALAVARSAEHLYKSRYSDEPGYYDEIISLYVDGVSRFDRVKLAAILDRLTACGVIDDDSLLVITSDHGEARHTWNGIRYFSNGADLEEGHIRVPLILRSPNHLPAGRVVPAQVSQVDLVPTILKLAGGHHDDPDAFDGRDLARLIADPAGRREPDHVYAGVWVYRGGLDQFGRRDAVQRKTLRKLSVRTGGFRYECLGGGAFDPEKQNEPETAPASIRQVYERYLGRFASLAEIAWWTARLKATGLSVTELARAFREHLSRRGLLHRLFDLRQDPTGQRNLAGRPEHEETRARLHGLVEPVFEALLREGGGEGRLEPALEAALEERLRALGYL